MIRTALALGATTAVALLLSATAFGHTHATPTLTGTVGPSFSIKLTMNGKIVKTLKAGTYKLVALHELYGRQVQTITVADDKPADVQFVFGKQG